MTENVLKKDSKVKNNIPIIDTYTGIIIKSAFIYVAFYCIGLLGYYLVNIPFSETLNKYIVSYFSGTFNFNASMSDNILYLVYSSYSDIRTLFLIFIAGFTMFSTLAIYGLLFFHAFSLGFSSLYLVNAMTAGLISEVSFLNLIYFLFANAAISAVLIVFSSKTRVFNDKFRSLGGRKKLIIRSKPLYVHIYTFLYFCGALLLINIIRYIFNVFN